MPSSPPGTPSSTAPSNPVKVSKSKKRARPESDDSGPSKKSKTKTEVASRLPPSLPLPLSLAANSPLQPSHPPPPPPPPPSPHLPRIDVLGAFESFSRGLATLLHPSISQEVLTETFGEAKSNFLLALRSMKDTGELAWLTAPPLLQPPPKLVPPAIAAAAAATSAAAAAGSGAQWPPQLPPIHNAHLQKQIFTHKSHIQGQYASAHGVEHAHYERLEYLGDAYLQVIASHVLFDRFPAYREGGLSEMRQRLVCNSNLATYAEAYRMHQAFRGARGTETYQKNIADCFEAYVGALVLDRPTIAAGLREATDWLMALLEPKIREMEQQRGGVAALDKNAKQKLHLVVHGEHVRLDYRWTGGGGGNQGGYWMTVFLTGWGFCNKELGKGWGTKKLYPTLFLCICLSVCG